MNRAERLRAQREDYLAWARTATTDELPDDFGPRLPAEWLAASVEHPLLLLAEGRAATGAVYPFSFLRVEQLDDGSWRWSDGTQWHATAGAPVQNGDGNWTWIDGDRRWTVRRPTPVELVLVRADARSRTVPR